MIELICIDHDVQGDLMFWDQLARGLASRSISDVQIGLVLGSAENTERELETLGYDVKRVDGALHVSEKAGSVYEISMREENRRAVTRLTDEGVVAAGFLGSDRGLLKHIDDAWIASKLFKKGLWEADQVVLVVSSVGRSEQGCPVDISPLNAARIVSSALSDECQIIHLSQHVTPRMKEAVSAAESTSSNELKRDNAIPGWYDFSDLSKKYAVSHVSWIGSQSGLKIH